MSHYYWYKKEISGLRKLGYWKKRNWTIFAGPSKTEEIQEKEGSKAKD